MTQFEIFDGPRYLFTVPPSEDPRRTLEDERTKTRNFRLRLVAVERGKRTEIEGPAIPPPSEDDFEIPKEYLE